ncbi:alpha/beta fold hydrolase [Tsukamurella asaccharolytica]|nr:alpha/beta hydrolase [Tsukamurella asaccharolytica]
MSRDRTAAPDPGGTLGPALAERHVTVPDGRTVRTVVAGSGAGPLVVFEAGISGTADTWVHSQRAVSAHCRTLAYDRAGYGGSDVDAADRTLERIVDDLTSVLDASNETGPVVLVGHSWGGPIARLFADRYPQRVAGLVLVDSSVAEVFSERSVRSIRWMFRVLRGLIRAGGGRLAVRAFLPHGVSTEVSQADLATITRDWISVRAMEAAGREAEHIVDAFPLMRRLQVTGPPDVPTICLQGGRIDMGAKNSRRIIIDSAVDSMARVSNGKAVVIEDAGHLIPLEAPSAMHSAIFEVLTAARTNSRLEGASGGPVDR